MSFVLSRPIFIDDFIFSRFHLRVFRFEFFSFIFFGLLLDEGIVSIESLISSVEVLTCFVLTKYSLYPHTEPITKTNNKIGSQTFESPALEYDEIELAPQLRARTLAPDSAMVDYLESHGMKRISKRLAHSGALDVVATAVPGMKKRRPTAVAVSSAKNAATTP